MTKDPPHKVKNDIHKLLHDLDNDPRRLKQVIADCMLLIQDIIDIVHTASLNETRFTKLITNAFQIEQLKKRGVIDIEYHAALLEANGIFLSDTELELSCLIYNGFEPHVLRKIYDHSNPDSIHVRIHRMRTKMRGQMALEHEEEEKEEVFDF